VRGLKGIDVETSVPQSLTTPLTSETEQIPSCNHVVKYGILFKAK